MRRIHEQEGVPRRGTRDRRRGLLPVALPTLLTTLALLGACASAPRPTIELSEVVDEQIAAMQRSHEAFVRLYYDELREDVQSFLDETWTPRFLARTLSGETESSRRLLEDLDSGYRLRTVDPGSVTIEMDEGAIPDERTREALRNAVASAVERQGEELGAVMIGYARAALEQIEAQRSSMLRPIDDQEALVLAEIRTAYADVFRANASVKAHLASVADVVREREVVLRRLGLLERQRELLDAAVAANDRTVVLLAEAHEAEDALDAFRVQMEETLARLTAIRDRLSGGGTGGTGGSGDDGGDTSGTP